MKLMPIIEKHRENSRKYLKSTKISVPNKFVAKVISFALPFIKSEQPVYIDTKCKL